MFSGETNPRPALYRLVRAWFPWFTSTTILISVYTAAIVHIYVKSIVSANRGH